MSDQMERPPLTHTVKLEDGVEKEIKMSYGLFQDLQRVTPDPGAIVEVITMDAPARDYMIRRALTDSRKMITKEEDLIPMEDCGLDDPTEIAGLLKWISGHLLYFFATAAGDLKKVAEVMQAKLGNLQPQPSSAGSAS